MNVPTSCRLAGFALALVLLGAPLLAADTPDASPTPAPEPVPVPEISTRAAEVTNLLRQIESQLQPDPAIEDIKDQVPALKVQVDAETLNASQVLDAQPPLETADGLYKTWSERADRLNGWRDALTSKALDYEAVIDNLSGILKVWKYTASVLAPDTPPVSVDRVKVTIQAIRESQKAVKHERSSVLALQDQASELLGGVEQIVTLAERARVLRIENLLSADAPRIWELPARVGNVGEQLTRLRRVVVAQGKSILDFARANTITLTLHLGCIFALALLLVRAKRRVQATDERAGATVDVKILELPASAALLLGLSVVPWLNLPAPRAAYDIAALLALIPVVRLGHRLLDRVLHPWLYALGGFYLTDRLRAVIATAPVLEQSLFLLEMVTAVAVLGSLLNTRHFGRLQSELGPTAARLIRSAALPLFGLFSFATLVSSMGYGQLGRLLGGGALQSLYLGITLYAGRRAVEGVVGYGLSTHLLQRFNVVRLHAITVFVQCQRIFHWATVIAWAIGSLAAFALLDNARGLVTGILGAGFSRGSLTVTVGDLVAFGLTVWFSFALSRTIRFVLEEDIYPRLHVAPGIPYALSRLVHYSVLTAGFFAAAAMIGLDTDRLAFLIGAFGVGIGFGLQNVVNNFVSGVILLFERPVQVGDSVQIGDLVGKVERIGIRSSTLRTATGAEVIVPNANLIADPLTNWTLSDRRRMIQIPIGIAYGTDTKRVVEVLEEIARNHPLALTEPAPRALFIGFGDSSLNFELRLWTGDFDSWVIMRSEVMMAIDARFKDEKIEIPFPQRDVHVRA